MKYTVNLSPEAQEDILSYKNRMTYQIHENIITVLVFSAMGHYDDK